MLVSTGRLAAPYKAARKNVFSSEMAKGGVQCAGRKRAPLGGNWVPGLEKSKVL